MPMLAMIQSFDDMLGALGLDSAELVRVLLRIFMIWALAWIGFRVVRLVSKRIVARVDDRDDKTLTLREKRGQTIAQLVQGVGRVLILFIAILLTLNIFIDIGPLLAGAGVAGLAISFGAQTLVKDVFRDEGARFGKIQSGPGGWTGRPRSGGWSLSPTAPS